MPMNIKYVLTKSTFLTSNIIEKTITTIPETILTMLRRGCFNKLTTEVNALAKAKHIKNDPQI